MTGYIQAALLHFKHTPSNQPEHAPYKYLNPTHSRQLAKPIPDDTNAPLQPPHITRLQKIIGTLLYYSRVVDPILLTVLNEITTQHTNDAKETAKAITELLHFCAIYPNASLFFSANDMVLHVDSDASYLSPSKARSKTGGNCYLNDLSHNPTKEPTIPLRPNRPVFPVCHILRHIMVSAAGVEITALFKYGQEAVLLRNTSVNLGRPQLPTRYFNIS